MTRYAYPHTIENGAGERITFFRVVPSATGDRVELENVIGPGSGPPMHVHHHQNEALTIRQGRMSCTSFGEPERFAEVGDTIAFSAGVPHRFRNVGDGELHCTGYVEPAHNIEYFLTELYDSTKRNGGERPSLFEAAFLMRRYRAEFTMTEIPAPVQRFVFPILVGLGHMLGKYARYADAPAAHTG